MSLFVEQIDLELPLTPLTEFENCLNSLTERINCSLYNIKFQDCLNSLVNLGLSQFPNIESVIISNTQLRLEIDQKTHELTELQTQHEYLKKAYNLVVQEIKETHEALLMGKKYYKKFLNTYYTFETRTEDKQVVFIQFFTETKKDSDKLYSLRLLQNKNKKYTLLDTNPVLSNIKDLNRLLQETDNLQSLLCCVRQAFSTIKMKRIESQKHIL